MTNDIITDAYVTMITERIEAGYAPSLLTFMFKQMAGTPEAVGRRMDRDVESSYHRSAGLFARKPRSPSQLDMLPTWIICPDWPVFKTKLQPLRDLSLNNGQHRHAVALVPPGSRSRHRLCDEVHVLHDKMFLGYETMIDRVHCRPITETAEKAARYVLKSLERARVEAGDIWVLPKPVSELPSLSRCPRDDVMGTRIRLLLEGHRA